MFHTLVRQPFQAQRAHLFMRLVAPKAGATVLDLGGGPGHFFARVRNHFHARCVVADIASDFTHSVQRHGFEFALLKEDGPLPFKNQEFDIVFCNSVIEHVTLPKELCSTSMSEQEWQSRAWDRQMEFADEIRRVGTAYFVQTPHKEFPFETHVLLPFAHRLNHNQMLTLIRFTNRYWLRRWKYVDWNLLGIKEMRALFPEAQIHVERILGMPKSIIAYVKQT
jgi:hypothetical protein